MTTLARRLDFLATDLTLVEENRSLVQYSRLKKCETDRARSALPRVIAPFLKEMPQKK